jgi:YGGT family
MEKSMTPDETIGTQPTEAYPVMEELPRKPLPHQYAVQPPPPPPEPNEPPAQPQPAEPLEGSESPIIGRERTLQLIFGIRKLNAFLLWFLMVLEVTLLIEFFLMLIGAAQNNLFASFMYALTVIPLYPFNGIVPPTKLGASGAVIEWSTLIAMAVYFLFFYALRRFLSIIVSDTDESE